MSVQALAVGLAVPAFVLAAWLAWLAIAYARRRGMLDQPGRRRSHVVATPRGGGIGIVAGVLATAPVALLLAPAGAGRVTTAALLGGGLLVAVVGWWDDHGGLPVLPRLAAQLFAGILFSAALCAGQGLAPAWVPLLVLAAGWSINLHNFMDGIDGLLAGQALFVGCAIAALALHAGQTAVAVASLCMASASAGFGLFNRPPARIFMGDVGSGFLGFMIFALAALLWVRVRPLFWPLLIACSCFVVDAGLTLASRMWRGRRWYTAHREHLYQWLVRRGMTHAQTGRLYMLWNLLLVAPLTWAAVRLPAASPWLCLGAYALAALVWWQGRRICLRAARGRGRARGLA